MERIVLVTGGIGLIGSHLCKTLLSVGRHVICIDDCSTGRAENLVQLQSFDNFTFISHDVTNPLPPLPDIRTIYHLACPASPLHYQKDPVKTVKTNVSGTINVLETAMKHNARVLLASTSEVYGNPDVHPQPESYTGNVSTRSPRSCYDEGKRCAETLCFDYARQYDVNITVARIFNTYGPNMAENDGRVISNFIINALRHHPLRVHGSGRQTRSFCYVTDMAAALTALAEHPDNPSGPVNLGNTTEVSVNNLAHLIVSLADSPSPVVHDAQTDNDPLRRRPDITLARNLLNWEPETVLEDGLRETIRWFSTVI